ncbi:MAG: D-alanyl-D-alanine carboxypeptidase [Hyphomicrobiaceae bacterium]
MRVKSGGGDAVLDRVFRRFADALRLVAFASAIVLGLLALPVAASAAPYADIVIDANTGQVLHERDADARRYPASLTKMMTLYIVFEQLKKGRLSLDTELTVSARADGVQPSKLGLGAGATITVENAIKALVTKSANDIAVTIAENLGGTEQKFARYMTWTAKRIGMRHTVFQNASGLPDASQATTARDLAILAIRLYDDFPEHVHYFKTRTFTYRGRSYRNHNGLLFGFQGTEGIKTGYTRASGFNLVASVRRDGKHLIGVVLGGESAGSRNSRMRSLLTTAFGKASSKRTRKPAAEPTVVAAVPGTATKKAAAGDAGKATATMPEGGYTGLTKATPVTTPTTTSATSEPRTTAASGPFHVQVGAYDSEGEAYGRLMAVSGKARSIVAGHDPVAVSFVKGEKTWYRARFAGFEEAAARATCASLKKQSIDCIVMRAD